MNNDLPIKINASQVLLSRYEKLKSVSNKQEAQINFQTLAADWYEDENDIITIEIHLVCAEELQQQGHIDGLGKRKEISDDVVSYIDNKTTTCFIAITDSEAKLLDKEPKLLSGYLAMKIKKVMNEIAKQQNLLALLV